MPDLRTPDSDDPNAGRWFGKGFIDDEDFATKFMNKAATAGESAIASEPASDEVWGAALTDAVMLRDTLGAAGAEEVRGVPSVGSRIRSSMNAAIPEFSTLVQGTPRAKYLTDLREILDRGEFTAEDSNRIIGMQADIERNEAAGKQRAAKARGRGQQGAREWWAGMENPGGGHAPMEGIEGGWNPIVPRPSHLNPQDPQPYDPAYDFDSTQVFGQNRPTGVDADGVPDGPDTIFVEHDRPNTQLPEVRRLMGQEKLTGRYSQFNFLAHPEFWGGGYDFLNYNPEDDNLG
jgi:hypothetical protein